MKKEWTMTAAVLLLLTLVMSPMMTLAGNANVTPTTTLPSYTTTTTWGCDCCSSLPPMTLETTTTDTTLREGPSGGTTVNTGTTTSTTCYLCGSATTTLPYTTTTNDNLCVTNTTFPPTTTTTIVLTGPDGTAPTTVTPTTDPTTGLCGLSVDLLSTAHIVTSEKLSMLGNPAGGYWLSCDCYSYNGETITITPINGSGWDIRSLPYLHITIRNNTPFSIMINGESASAELYAQAVGSDTAIIAQGAYVVSLDLAAFFTELHGAAPSFVSITDIQITMHQPGSITVGHVALSDQPVCMEAAPNIQTTTIPSFPWHDTTTETTTTYETTYATTFPSTTRPTTLPPTMTTSPTTNPTVNDALLPGDADQNGIVSTADVRLILVYLTGNFHFDEHSLLLADFNGDGTVNSSDAREILKMLTQ